MATSPNTPTAPTGRIHDWRRQTHRPSIHQDDYTSRIPPDTRNYTRLKEHLPVSSPNPSTSHMHRPTHRRKKKATDRKTPASTEYTSRRHKKRSR